MDNSIKITITGAVGSGKSTLTELIAQTLGQHGIRVHLGNGTEDAETVASNLTANLARMANGLAVTIEQVQTTKEPHIFDEPRYKPGTPTERLEAKLAHLFVCMRKPLNEEAVITLSGFGEMQEYQKLVAEITGTTYEVPFAHVLEQGHFSVKRYDMNFHLHWIPVAKVHAIADVEACIQELLLQAGKEGNEQVRIRITNHQAAKLKYLIAAATGVPCTRAPFGYQGEQGQIRVVFAPLSAQYQMTWYPAQPTVE